MKNLRKLALLACIGLLLLSLAACGGDNPAGSQNSSGQNNNQTNLSPTNSGQPNTDPQNEQQNDEQPNEEQQNDEQQNDEQQNDEQQNSGQPVDVQGLQPGQAVSQLTAAAAATLAEGDSLNIEVTPQLRQQFFGLAQKYRWDFLPSFPAYQPLQDWSQPTVISEYYYLITAQALVWREEPINEPPGYFYYSIDHEQSPDTISPEYFSEYIKRHFNVEPQLPSEPADSKAYVFDGENFLYPTGSWSEPPLGRLVELTLSRENDRVIYNAVIEYQRIADDDDWWLIPEDILDIIAGDSPEAGGLAADWWSQISFYLDQDFEPVYVKCQSTFVFDENSPSD